MLLLLFFTQHNYFVIMHVAFCEQYYTAQIFYSLFFISLHLLMTSVFQLLTLTSKVAVNIQEYILVCTCDFVCVREIPKQLMAESYGGYRLNIFFKRNSVFKKVCTVVSLSLSIISLSVVVICHQMQSENARMVNRKCQK